MSLTTKDYENLGEAIKHYVLGKDSAKRLELLRGENSVRNRLARIADSPYFKNNNFFNKLDLSATQDVKGYDGVTFSLNLTSDGEPIRVPV